MDTHLEEEGVSNRRNGRNTKNVQRYGESFELEVSKDRKSSFSPEIIKKRRTVLRESLDQQSIRLYEGGRSLCSS